MSARIRFGPHEIERARAARIEVELGAHFSKLKQIKNSGAYVGPCPKCGGNDRFAINTRKQVWNCRGCKSKNIKGDVIGLVQFLDGCGFGKAIKTLTSTTVERTVSPDPPSKVKSTDANEEEQRRVARWLWSQRRPATGSLVETYLRARGYTGAIPPTLGYLPARDGYPPSMIAAYALPNEIEPGVLGPPLTIMAVHVTDLQPDGSDRVRAKGAKRTIARPLGLPIAISSITDGLSLAISEGIEDALALAAAGFATWAAGSAPYFPALAAHIPDYITTVIIEQHPDPDQRAQSYTAQLAELLRARKPREGELPLEVIMRKATT
jgi:hypothetical protein